MVRDTAGQEELSAMRDQYIRAGQGFVIVYSVGSRSSFDALDKFRSQVLRVKDEANYFPMVICGNKCDLPPSSREVTPEMGQDYCQNLGIKYFETSAKDKINVVESFSDAVREVQKFNNIPTPDDNGNVKKRRSGLSCSLL
eukprot:TRINITY_DN123_c0_g1_i3.p1 TRINITY_DN123_c0_g1~~TRINITY_DN123_c0_g1_i3.p1  ORF type:complete len:141 (-),score=31.08 TRINITY_DN123_c0_g1_i3:62-484(-)